MNYEHFYLPLWLAIGNLLPWFYIRIRILAVDENDIERIGVRDLFIGFGLTNLINFLVIFSIW